jgi:hypothetical protein|tara:strand:+ start:211 stop:639 length:429 start_codon:yes stop_codon:yes gene_type:complete
MYIPVSKIQFSLNLIYICIDILTNASFFHAFFSTGTTSFISTLFRDSAQMRNSKVDLQNMNIVIVTHGLAIRLFLMRWFQYSVDDFEETYNPTNGSLNIMERHENEHGEQWFEIENETKKRLNLDQVHQSINKMHGGGKSSL